MEYIKCLKLRYSAYFLYVEMEAHCLIQLKRRDSLSSIQASLPKEPIFREENHPSIISYSSIPASQYSSIISYSSIPVFIIHHSVPHCLPNSRRMPKGCCLPPSLIDFHILNLTRPEGGGCIVIRRRPITL